MARPDFSKFATLEGYYRALANHYLDRWEDESIVAKEAITRLYELGEVGFDDDGEPYWKTTGELLGLS